MNNIFYCYSRPLKDFLIKNGHRYFSGAIHENTKKKFWMFNRTEELNDILTIWKNRKH